MHALLSLAGEARGGQVRQCCATRALAMLLGLTGEDTDVATFQRRGERSPTRKETQGETKGFKMPRVKVWLPENVLPCGAGRSAAGQACPRGSGAGWAAAERDLRAPAAPAALGLGSGHQRRGAAEEEMRDQGRCNLDL